MPESLQDFLTSSLHYWRMHTQAAVPLPFTVWSDAMDRGCIYQYKIHMRQNTKYCNQVEDISLLRLRLQVMGSMLPFPIPEPVHPEHLEHATPTPPALYMSCPRQTSRCLVPARLLCAYGLSTTGGYLPAVKNLKIKSLDYSINIFDIFTDWED